LPKLAQRVVTRVAFNYRMTASARPLIQPPIELDHAQGPDKGAPCSSRQRGFRLVLLAASLTFSLLAFLALDWLHTARLRRHSPLAVGVNPCRIRDAVNHHALKPNCASVEYWGTDRYQFFTNSLGFRDERVRDVPLADDRPRILMLGDSFTEGMIAWPRSFVGRIAGYFPQYDFLNGGLSGYSASNHLEVARMVLRKGVDIDEVIVFIDNSQVHYDGAYYRDLDSSGAVTGPEREQSAQSWYTSFRHNLAGHFLLTSRMLRLFDRLQRPLVLHGYYHLPGDYFGDPFDREMSAWSYRKVNETARFPAGYAPLGVEGGIAKSQTKMTLLWQELQRRNIPISVVVYPHLGQLVYDTADSREVKIWRDWCEGKCKRFISVLPAFYAAKQQCPRTQPGCWYEKLFVFGDIHYSAGGNALVADATIKALQEDPPAKRQTQSVPTQSAAVLSLH